MRISQQKLNPSLKKEIKRTLVLALSDFKGEKEVDLFLADFLTDSEFESFAKRLAIAYWLKKGRSYENIRKNLRVSSATIANVQSMMDKDGFKLALKKIEAEEWASAWAQKIQKVLK